MDYVSKMILKKESERAKNLSETAGGSLIATLPALAAKIVLADYTHPSNGVNCIESQNTEQTGAPLARWFSGQCVCVCVCVCVWSSSIYMTFLITCLSPSSSLEGNKVL